MNTTNLITDYIISGILGLIAIFMPYFLINNGFLIKLLAIKIENSAAVAVILTVVAYSFGVVFNQMADRVEDWLFKKMVWIENSRVVVWLNRIERIKKMRLFKMTRVEKIKDKLKANLGGVIDHQLALQIVVHASESAYQFISFRRTMIRILRSMLCLTVFLSTLHIFYAVTLRSLFHQRMVFSYYNLIVCLFSLLISYPLARTLSNLYKGYYAALTNFVKVILKDIPTLEKGQLVNLPTNVENSTML